MLDELKKIAGKFKTSSAPSALNLQPHSQNNIIAIANQKGGSGKTTTVVNLGVALTQDFRVLIIDLDPQAHATLSLGLEPEKIPQTIYDVLVERQRRLLDVILRTNLTHLDIVPANILLAGAELELVQMQDRGLIQDRSVILKEKAKEILSLYDFILIDCPPSLGLLTLNALSFAESVIVPVQTHYFALEGTRQLFNTIEIIRQRLNPGLKILGLVPTLFDGSAVASEILCGLRDFFQENVFESVIRVDPKFVEASSAGKPISLYSPYSEGAKDYEGLAKEVIKHARIRIPAGT